MTFHFFTLILKLNSKHIQGGNMKVWQWLSMAAMIVTGSIYADVPELTALVPEAKNFELIAKVNPARWHNEKYLTERFEALEGNTLTRIGYLLKITAKDGKENWVFTSMAPFTQNIWETGVPFVGGATFQDYVDNLEVYSNVESVKTGKFEKGNIEFWGYNYGGDNTKNIPEATKKLDFGDTMVKSGNYGSMQVHNYLEKQTVFAFNFLHGANPDLGIGNNPNEKGNPDWTFSRNMNTYKSAELYIVGEFENLKVKEVVALDTSKLKYSVTTDRDPVTYAAGDKMVFTINTGIDGQKPTGEYYITWTRTGDDKKVEKGKELLSDKNIMITTSIDQPGFIRLQAAVVNKIGMPVRYKNKNNQWVSMNFDGGAGADIDKLQSTPEPEDFDAFWTKQKARLAEVPMKANTEKVNTINKVNVYKVSIDCAGPRPVTGYLTIPENAAEKSLPAAVTYFGYGVRKQGPPSGNLNTSWITFAVNAHGFELNQNDKYYQDFANSIKSNKQIYAFDPKQNTDPETAYFNGMAFRVMRSLEFIKSLPEWNGKQLVVKGGSQGGLQAIWAAALDSDVTKSESGITWCCDLSGNAVNGRLKGWFPQWVPALGYYDAVNHAKRVKCQVDITRAGLGDYTCPPSGIAILYNNLKAPKKINWVQGSTHGYVPPDAQRFVHESK